MKNSKHLLSNTTLLIALLACSFILTSCRKACRKKDDKLTIAKTQYTGSLYTDGYYHSKLQDNNYTIFILYRNGVKIREHPVNLTEFENALPDNDYTKSKVGWGLFRVEGTSIRIETWEPYPCGYPVGVHEGVILNDSTFVINEYFRAVNNEYYTLLNDTFYFKHTSIKPDSVQSYL